MSALNFSGMWGQKYNAGGVAAFHLGKRWPYKVILSDPSKTFYPADTFWHSSKSAVHVQPAVVARILQILKSQSRKRNFNGQNSH